MRFKVRLEPAGRRQVKPPPQDARASARGFGPTQCCWGRGHSLGFHQGTQRLLPGGRLRQARSVARKEARVARPAVLRPSTRLLGRGAAGP